jgi:hypothetical protein
MELWWRYRHQLLDASHSLHYRSSPSLSPSLSYQQNEGKEETTEEKGEKGEKEKTKEDRHLLLGTHQQQQQRMPQQQQRLTQQRQQMQQQGRQQQPVCRIEDALGLGVDSDMDSDTDTDTDVSETDRGLDSVLDSGSHHHVSPDHMDMFAASATESDSDSDKDKNDSRVGGSDDGNGGGNEEQTRVCSPHMGTAGVSLNSVSTPLTAASVAVDCDRPTTSPALFDEVVSQSVYSVLSYLLSVCMY